MHNMCCFWHKLFTAMLSSDAPVIGLMQQSNPSNTLLANFVAPSESTMRLCTQLVQYSSVYTWRLAVEKRRAGWKEGNFWTTIKMFTDTFQNASLLHTQRPAVMRVDMRLRAATSVQTRSTRCVDAALARQAPRARQQAWTVCATLTTERPSTAGTVWPCPSCCFCFFSIPSTAGVERGGSPSCAAV